MIIYKTTNIMNGKIYVGKDKNNDPAYLGSGIILSAAIQKYGKDSFIKEILQECNDINELNDMEIYWISYYNSTDRLIGYNIALGGAGGDTISKNPNRDIIAKKHSETMKGKRFSEIHKQNISKAKKGKSIPSRPQTEATRKKLSESHKGKTLTEETKKKMSESRMGRVSPMKGKKWTDERREKYAETLTELQHPRGIKIQISDSNGMIYVFSSARSAAEFFTCSVHRILNNNLNDFTITRI